MKAPGGFLIERYSDSTYFVIPVRGGDGVDPGRDAGGKLFATILAPLGVRGDDAGGGGAGDGSLAGAVEASIFFG